MEAIHWNSIGLFADLSEAEIEQIKTIFSPIEVPAGQPVISEGETGDEMYILWKGRIRIIKSMLITGMNIPFLEVSQASKVLATLDGDRYPIFGEMAMLDSDTRSATVETLEDSYFMVTDRDKFFSLVKANPALGVKLLSGIGRKLAYMVRNNNRDVVKLTTALALALGRKN